MTDTKTCATCGATAPAAAAFCTSCGQPMAAAAAAPPPPAPPAPPAPDQTRVETPGLHDATQVAPPPPPAPGAPVPPPPVSPAEPAGPWGPTDTAAPPTGPPTTAPWNPPAAPPPPSWQQPQAPPDAATYNPAGQPPLGGSPTWAPPGAAAPGAWGSQPLVAPAPSTKSPLGGIVAIIGALLTIAGVFSGWVTLDPGSNSETVSGWSLTTGDGILKSNDAYVLVALAIVGALLGVLLFTGVARPLVRIATVLLGVGVVVVALLNWMAIASFVEDNLPSSFTAKQAVGFFMAIGGGVVIAIAGLLPAKKA